MSKKNQKNNEEGLALAGNDDLALACDKYVNGKDRIAGYIVVQDGIPIGNLTKKDIERFQEAGELKVVE